MKIYMLYIKVPDTIFHSKLKYLMDSVYDYNFKIKNGMVISLYAWADKKKLYKRFLEERCPSIFEVSIKDMDDEDFEAFSKKYAMYELKLTDIANVPLYDGYERNNNVDIPDKNNFIEMCVTKCELVNFSTNRSENMAEFGPRAYEDMNYNIFNDDIIDSLKVLGYKWLYNTSFLHAYNNNDIEDDEKDLYCGEVMNLIHTEYVAFIYLYSYTFIGK